MNKGIRLSSTARISENENILPLINVVLLLLFFFMVAGTLKVSELFLVKVPVATVDPAKSETLTVIMNSNGEFAIGSSAYSGINLTHHLKAYKDKHPKRTSVILKADAEATAAQLLIAMDYFSQADIEYLQLLTLEEP